MCFTLLKVVCYKAMYIKHQSNILFYVPFSSALVAMGVIIKQGERYYKLPSGNFCSSSEGSEVTKYRTGIFRSLAREAILQIAERGCSYILLGLTFQSADQIRIL